MSRYVNPDHPAGPLYPQSTGMLGGARTRGADVRDRRAQLPRDELDPTFAAAWLGERERFVRSMAAMDARKIE